jgi:hypothetical protein
LEIHQNNIFLFFKIYIYKKINLKKQSFFFVKSAAPQKQMAPKLDTSMVGCSKCLSNVLVLTAGVSNSEIHR